MVNKKNEATPYKLEETGPKRSSLVHYNAQLERFGKNRSIKISLA